MVSSTPSVALVTGGSRGIGAAIATRLAQDGRTVAVHYGRNAVAAEQTVRQIEASGGTAFAIGQELEAIDGVERLFATLDDELARRDLGDRLAVLVNNAGIAIEDGLDGVTEAAFAAQVAVNMRAPLLATQAAARRLGAGGRIITISSATTRQALPEWLVYTMTKAALDSMTRIVARELAPRGITVNAVAAGVVDTEMNVGLMDDPHAAAEAAAVAALGRIGQPDDVADVVAFLASEQARWVTGQVVDASGGSFL